MSKIEQFRFDEIGYKKLMHYKSWRIAMLNYIYELEPENIHYMDAHLETDEIFVLLEGKAILFELNGENVTGLKLEKNTIYNVKAGLYHTHVLSKDCKLLIVEEESTNDSNTTRHHLTDKQKQAIIDQWRNYEI